MYLPTDKLHNKNDYTNPTHHTDSNQNLALSKFAPDGLTTSSHRLCEFVNV